MNFREGTKAALFIELAKPDRNGFSREVYVSEFNGKYVGLIMGNGGPWCRTNGPLGKIYQIKRHKKKNKIHYVQLIGLNDSPTNRNIPQKIRYKFSGKRCVVLCTGNPEIDHKNGRESDSRLSDSSRLEESDFQALSKAANDAKRQHCKVCRDTNNRFDAKKLGYCLSQIEGNGVYRGCCVGCYWHDTYAFNKAISKDFKK